MTRQNLIRLVVYSTTTALCGALFYLSYVHQGEPEIGTILNGADILSRVGAHDQAIVECEKVLERDPGNLQAHLIYACSLDRLGRATEAIEKYRESLPLAKEPGLALEVRLSVADLERRTGDFEGAIRDCEAIDADCGPSSRSSLVRAYALSACDEPEAAGAAYRESVALDPGHVLARWAFGCYCLDSGEYGEALDQFEIVHSLDPSRRPAYPTAYKIAQARIALEDPVGALQALDESSRTWRGFTKKNLPDDPSFGALRGNPAFDALIADLVQGNSRRS